MSRCQPHLLPAPRGSALDEVCHKVILGLAVYGGQVPPLGPALVAALAHVVIVRHQTVAPTLKLGPALGTRRLYNGGLGHKHL